MDTKTGHCKANGIAYLAFNNGLVVVDASNPEMASELARLPLDDRPIQLNGDGNWLLVTSETGHAHLGDISDPSTPRLLWTYRPPDGNLILAAAVHGDLGYLATESGLEVLHLSDSKPQRLALVASGGCGEHVRLISDYLLLPGCGVDVLHLSQPEEPKFLYSINESKYVFDASANDHLLVAVGERLQIYTWQPPVRPRSVAELSLGDDVATGVSLIGEYAYLSLENGGLRLFDLSNPADPIEIAYDPTRRASTGLWVDNGILYLADDQYPLTGS